MSGCKSCIGEGYKMVGGKTITSDCSTCIAEKLIKGNSKMGILTPERAMLLCSCFANGHKGVKKSKPSKEIIKVVDDHREKNKVEEEEIAKIPNIFQEKEAEAKAYYIKRVEQLKLLDAEQDVPYHSKTKAEIEAED